MTVDLETPHSIMKWLNLCVCSILRDRQYHVSVCPSQFGYTEPITPLLVGRQESRILVHDWRHGKVMEVDAYEIRGNE